MLIHRYMLICGEIEMVRILYMKLQRAAFWHMTILKMNHVYRENLAVSVKTSERYL